MNKGSLYLNEWMVALNELKFNQNFNSRNEHFMVFSNRNDKIGRNKILDRLRILRWDSKTSTITVFSSSRVFYC